MSDDAASSRPPRGASWLDALEEGIRLVIWDLDETFWRGTLSEGGIDYRAEHDAIIVELARRGIVSSLCSKNDRAAVEQVFAGRAVREHIVFPQIDWEAKGPKLKMLVELMRLRPQTMLFIDDNPMMRGEAAHFVPGINVAGEDVIPYLLDHPKLRGKDDRELSRLRQYQLLERRHADAPAIGGDTSAFLRDSGIVVTIEYDVEAHIDRAIELINRTNQLNFTKHRLSENIDTAREQLRRVLRGYETQSGLVRVRDRYGDYGFVGLYVEQRSVHPGSGLRYFCFSCRTLGMKVETWLYRRLGSPPIDVLGDVASDLFDMAPINWIADGDHGFQAQPATSRATIRSAEVMLRGGCELLAISHYCRQLADATHGEFAGHLDGIQIRREHSVMARHAIDPPPAAVLDSFCKLGFAPDDFSSRMLTDSAVDAIWIMSFWADPVYPLYRHRKHGALIPFNAFPAAHPFQDLTRLSPDDIAPEFRDHWIVSALRHLAEEYELAGITAEDVFKHNLHAILDRLPPRAHAFIIGSNEFVPPTPEGHRHVRHAHVLANGWTRDALAGRQRCHFIAASDYLRGDQDVDPVHTDHYDRSVYFRIFGMIAEALDPMPATVA